MVWIGEIEMIYGGAKFVGMGYDSPDAPWNQDYDDEEYEEEQEMEQWFEENGYEWVDVYGDDTYKCPKCNCEVKAWTKHCRCGQNIRWE